MTSRESFVFGWVWGRLDAELEAFDRNDKSGFKFRQAAAQPLSGMAQIMNAANQCRLLHGNLHKEICFALSEVGLPDDELSASPEPYQPLSLQGSWQMGCMVGRSKQPLPPASQDREVQ